MIKSFDRKLLGTCPDRELADLYKVHINTIQRWRQILGIEPYKSRHTWTDEQLTLLGKHRDVDVARMLNISDTQVKHKRRSLNIPRYIKPKLEKVRVIKQKFTWRPEDLARLGKETDVNIAKSLKLWVTTVCRKRKKLGIKPFDGWMKPNSPEWIKRSDAFRKIRKFIYTARG